MSDKKYAGNAEHRLACGRKCPVCGSDKAWEGSFNCTGMYVYQQYACRDCGYTWFNEYKLQGYTGLEDKDGKEVDRGPNRFCTHDEDLELMLAAAADAYAKEAGDDIIGKILAGDMCTDRLAEFVINEIRDVTHGGDEDQERADKFGEVAEAIGKADDQLIAVFKELGELYESVRIEEAKKRDGE